MRFDDVVERLAAALIARPGDELGLDDPRWPVPMRRAAVLVMLVDRGGLVTVPMIIRGDGAPVHGGQTALPGGRWEPEDDSMIATAVREAHEEVGVTADHLRVLGQLDDLPTRTGFLVRPVVAVLDAPVFVPSEAEVAGIFEVPLGLFTDRSNAEDLGVREIGAVSYPLRGYQHGEHRIWGVAARILEIVADLSS